MPDQLHSFLDELLRATNAHDLDALVDCFEPAYRNETPAHPGRNFQGAGQVRDNWQQIFSSLPDVHASVSRWAVDGAEVWSEWEMGGTRLDGAQQLMHGVIIFAVQDGRATSARFYLEPVDQASTTNVGAAVRDWVRADTPT